MRDLDRQNEIAIPSVRWCQLMEYHIAKGTGKIHSAKDGWTTSTLITEISQHLDSDKVLNRRTLDSWRKAKTLPKDSYRRALLNVFFPRGRVASPEEFDEMRTALAEAVAARARDVTAEKKRNLNQSNLSITSDLQRKEELIICLNRMDKQTDRDSTIEQVLKLYQNGADEFEKLPDSFKNVVRLFAATNCLKKLPDLAEFQDDWFAPLMICVPQGKFRMGAPAFDFEAYDNEKPEIDITVPHSFAVSKYPITFKEFDIYCNANNFDKPEDEDWGRGERPVIHVSWREAKSYVAWLNNKTSGGYRLLSEAEWEYAARAGTKEPYLNKNVIPAGIGNGAEAFNQTTRVGQFPPNSWGFHDFLGNVWEWVEDNWAPNYEQIPLDGSPLLFSQSKLRCLRGGSWDCSYKNMRVTDRCRQGHDNRINNVGFRVAKDIAIE